MRVALTAGAMLLAQTALADAPELSFPVDCTLGETCFVQNYVDVDSRDAYGDFSCGALSYDGHKGTDFGLRSHVDALNGVSVLAAAPGVVRGVRDGVADGLLGLNPGFPEGQDCGNGVVITHGDGWETQYCHLREGSVAVRSGQTVQAGDRLGEIGMSGRTEFPHLHISVRHDGQVIDPFDPNPDGSCGAPSAEQLWQTPITYDPGGLLQAGFASAVPEFDDVKFGTAHEPSLSADAGALVMWAHLFGAKAGDTLRLTITGPTGVFSETIAEFDRPQAQAMRAAGRRLHSENTVPGIYSGSVTLIRDGEEIETMRTGAILRE